MKLCKSDGSAGLKTMMQARMLVVLSLVLSGLVLSAGLKSCAPHWKLYEGDCYGFSQGVLTWVEALAVCRAYGGTLAEPRKSSVNSFLKREAKNRKYKDVWIGGNDLFKEGHFEWVSDKRAPTFRDFAPGEPIEQGGNEECLSLGFRFSYRWKDDPCHELKEFVCQKVA